MKNIEKCPNTSDALDAYNRALATGEYVSFSTWALNEYSEPKPPSLLYAAKAAADWMDGYHFAGGEINAVRDNLKIAIAAAEAAYKRESERAFVVRNCSCCSHYDRKHGYCSVQDTPISRAFADGTRLPIFRNGPCTKWKPSRYISNVKQTEQDEKSSGMKGAGK